MGIKRIMMLSVTLPIFASGENRPITGWENVKFHAFNSTTINSFCYKMRGITWNVFNVWRRVKIIFALLRMCFNYLFTILLFKFAKRLKNIVHIPCFQHKTTLGEKKKDFSIETLQNKVMDGKLKHIIALIRSILFEWFPKFE